MSFFKNIISRMSGLDEIEIKVPEKKCEKRIPGLRVKNIYYCSSTELHQKTQDSYERLKGLKTPSAREP